MRTVIKITDKGNGRLRGFCPSLPGCVCEGANQQEVLENMEVTIRGYLASLDAAVPENLLQEVAVA